MSEEVRDDFFLDNKSHFMSNEVAFCVLYRELRWQRNILGAMK